MREFVYGTDEQYEALEAELEDGQCHVYNGCSLPACCGGGYCRIGFEFDGTVYKVHISNGINCHGINASQLFRDWLRLGTLKFADFDSVKQFFRKLRNLC